jgi:hypothetical protein
VNPVVHGWKDSIFGGEREKKIENQIVRYIEWYPHPHLSPNHGGEDKGEG